LLERDREAINNQEKKQKQKKNLKIIIDIEDQNSSQIAVDPTNIFVYAAAATIINNPALELHLFLAVICYRQRILGDSTNQHGI
jgi:hypothetical protein